jgi:hypothetical protein
MDIIQLKKCGRTANNKLLVLIIKSQLNKKKRKCRQITMLRLQSAFKIREGISQKLERLDK